MEFSQNGSSILTISRFAHIYKCFATLLKWHFGMGALPQFCKFTAYFQKHLFLRTPLKECLDLLNKSLIEIIIFCAVNSSKTNTIMQTMCTVTLEYTLL